MFDEFIEAIKSGDWSAILLFIWVILRAILGVFEVIATKNTFNIKKFQIKEEETLKTRLPDYKEQKNFDKNSQKSVFTQYIPEYKYDEKTGELHATGGKIDVQAMIDSYVDTCLAAVLDKFLPGNDLTAQPVQDVYGEAQHTELNDLADMLEQAEVYREKYNLGDDISALEVFKAVNEMAEKQTAYVEGLTKKQEEVVKEPTLDELKAFYEAHKEETL